MLVEEHREDRFAGLVLKSLTRVCGPMAFGTQLPGISVILLRPGDEAIEAKYHNPEDMVSTHLASNLGYVHLSRSLYIDKRLAAERD